MICGSSYHNKYNPSRLEGECEICGGELIHRDDDKKEVVMNRLSVYSRGIKPLIDYYKELGILCKVQGNGAISDVFNRICASL